MAGEDCSPKVGLTFVVDRKEFLADLVDDFAVALLEWLPVTPGAGTWSRSVTQLNEPAR